MTETTLRVLRLPHGADLPLPSYQSAQAAGLDLLAAISAETPLVIAPGERALVPTGLVLALPPNCEGQVRARSGLAVKHGLAVLNAPGTIDADYRGEVQVPLINLGQVPVTITRGMRIAQLVIAPVVTVEVAETDAIESTVRGKSGFGSTGT
jgi:dUTP pyrophosphatase